MRTYSLGGRTVATAATQNHAGAQLWNPSASRTLFVTQIAWSKTIATADNLAVVRTSARGTAGSTVSSALQDDYDYDGAPPTGAVLDLAAFSGQPTIVASASPMFRWYLPAAIGSGFIWPCPAPIKVPPGTGLALITPTATILQPADVTFAWTE